MRENRARRVWDEGGVVVSGWLHNPSTYSAELMATFPYDALLVDLQHGMIDFQMAFSMLQAMSAHDVTPFVRPVVNDPAAIMKLLDAGACGVICPLVDTREECEQFVKACLYPPRGFRSNGAHRATFYAGADYQQHADDTIIKMAMIESRTALDNLDAIMDVDGLDGVFIGPTDLAFSLGCPPTLEASDPKVETAIDMIVAAAKKHRLRVGTVSSTGASARRCVEKGFDFVVPGTETGLLRQAALNEIATVRGQ